MQIKQAVSKMLITFIALLLINHVTCQDDLCMSAPISRLKGEKGNPGETGECACIEEIQELRRSVQSLSETVQELQPNRHQQTDSSRVRHCTVGMEDRRVRNEAITTNVWLNRWRLPKLGRLNNRAVSGRNLGSWGPENPSVGDWLQVDLQTPMTLTGVITQGIADTNFQEWVTTYQISYGKTPNDMDTIRDVSGEPVTFQGNRDRSTHVTNMFRPPIVARYVRLIALTWHNNIRVRLEYLTC